jgi:flagellar assembly factor FliW
LIDPFLFRPDFEADIADAEAALIGLETPEQAAALVIVTIPPEDAAGADAGAAQQATANLQGPLIINRETNTGCQIILSDPRWKTKHDITAGAPC